MDNQAHIKVTFVTQNNPYLTQLTFCMSNNYREGLERLDRNH